MRPLTFIGGGALLLLGATAAMAASEPRKRRSRPHQPELPREAPIVGGLYLPNQRAPFGPYHNARRPRGLPRLVAEAHGPAGTLRVDGLLKAPTEGKARRVYGSRHKLEPTRVETIRVRHASDRGAAVPHVRRVAGKHGIGEPFVKTMVDLARKEGEGGTFAVPARNFNSPCRSRAEDKARRCTTVDAPRKGKLITAWGVFQWNRDAGRYLNSLDDVFGLRSPTIASDWMPWDWTATEELELPIEYYAQLWRLVRRRGGSIRNAARGVRLWHTGPSRFRRFVLDGANSRAWARVPNLVARRIDHHLVGAGVA